MPRLVLPTDPTALVSVRYGPDSSDDTSVTQEDEQLATLRIEGASPTATTQLAIADLVNAAITGFVSQRAGPGARFDSGVEYGSSLTLPGAVRTMLWFPDGREDGSTSYARTLALRTRDATRADSAFDALAEAFAKAEAGYHRSDVQETPTSRLAFFDSDGMPAVAIARRTTASMHEVTFTVRAPESK